jgi:hypothetical protein
VKKGQQIVATGAGWSLMVLLAVLSGGCAMGTTRLAISHSPLVPVVPKRQGDVLVRPFVDTRPHPEHIGNKRNGYGMVLGHVAAREGVKIDALMTQYFIEALQDAGYNATLDTSTAGSLAPQVKCDAIIDGEIVEFWMDLYMMVWHRVGVKVKAINPADQKVTWEKLIQGAEKRTLWVGATGEYERIVRQAVTKALNRAAQEFASDDFYNKAIKKQP